MKVAGRVAVAGAICAALLASSTVATAGEASPCPGGKLRTASGCTGLDAAGREVRAIVERFLEANDLRAALTRIDVGDRTIARSEEHTSELQSLRHLVCRLLLEKKKEHN